MWKQQQGIQTLAWSYGKITILNKPYQFHPNVLTITTHPFCYHHNNALNLEIRSENEKGMRGVSRILDFFVERKAIRSSEVHIKGGGLLLDLAGFASSIYMRGLQNVSYIPTTLLSMVDATVGGKTGINFGSAKNIIGTVKHPKNVIIDINLLKQLPNREFFNGFAQIIKMAITYDRDFFQLLEKIDLKSIRQQENHNTLKHIIKKSLELKIKVVEKDQFENHERKWLNFGHTIGHGIELSANNQYLHGECVSIGMIKALELSFSLGILKDKQIISRLRNLLKKINLPTEFQANMDLSQMIELMLKDKKKSQVNDEIEFVFINEIGQQCQTTTKIKMKQVCSFLSKRVEIEQTYQINKQINLTFDFPSSKSISLRLAYTSALSMLKFNKSTKITNFLASEDTHCMLQSLKSMGFVFHHDENLKTLQMEGYRPIKQGNINIGNSGITARLILPLCSSIQGHWNVICHSRMSERPNQQIIKLCLEQFDCEITYRGKQFAFPLELITKQSKLGLKNSYVHINSKQSSQFLTSIMIYGSFFNNEMRIKTDQGNLVSQSYLEMTAKCLQFYGVHVQFSNGEIQTNSHQLEHIHQLSVQTDLSSLSYPYLFSKFHGISPPPLFKESMQGDILFYQYIQQLSKSSQKSIRLDFNNCTDTFMTMVMYIASDIIQKSSIETVTLYNIANQRVKESNRIHLTIKNLKKVGFVIEQFENQIRIIKKMNNITQKRIQFETQSDHRLAMSFTILSTFLKIKYPQVQFIIDDKTAVDKTFPSFWKYINQSGIVLKPVIQKDYLQSLDRAKSTNLILIGDRGSGKTTIGRQIASKLGYVFIDLDEQITKAISLLGHLSIAKYIQTHGWNNFRQIEQKVLQQVLCSKRPNSFVLATGAGIVQRETNILTIKRDDSDIIWIQKEFNHLRIDTAPHRPEIIDYKEVSRKRTPVYQQLATIIATIPQKYSAQQQASYVLKCIKDHRKAQQLKPGLLYVSNQIPIMMEDQNIDLTQLSAVQLRLDSHVSNGVSLSELRKRIALFRRKNSIDTILTLRSANQLGMFNGNYSQMINSIRKIPTDFLDHQFVHPIHYPYNSSKLILSYHGQNLAIINKLCNLNGFNGVKKLCFKDYDNKWKQYFQRLGDRSICIDLNNPVSRIYNKYQFVVKSPPIKNITGIFSIAEMKLLKSVKHLLKV